MADWLPAEPYGCGGPHVHLERDNVSAYDALYIALAESLDCPLLTADVRLSRAPGARCLVTVVPA